MFQIVGGENYTCKCGEMGTDLCHFINKKKLNKNGN